MSSTHRGYICGIRHMHQIQGVTLDIQAVYNTVWRTGLLRKLAEVGVEGYLVWWAQSFLMDRIAMLEVGGHTEGRCSHLVASPRAHLSPPLSFWSSLVI